MTYPHWRFRSLLLPLLAVLAFQCTAVGQETIQPQRIMDLGKIFGGKSAGTLGPSNSPVAKFKRAFTTPAFQGGPTLIPHKPSTGFAAQAPIGLHSAPTFESSPSFLPRDGFHSPPQFQNVNQPATEFYPAPNVAAAQAQQIQPNFQTAPTFQSASFTEPTSPLGSAPALGPASQELELIAEPSLVRPDSTLPGSLDDFQFDQLPSFPDTNTSKPQNLPLQTINGNRASTTQSPSYPVAPELSYSNGYSDPYANGYSNGPSDFSGGVFQGGSFTGEETGAISPSHWGVDSRAQIVTESQQYFDPVTGLPSFNSGAGIPSPTIAVSPNYGSFPINAGKREQRPINRIGQLDEFAQDYDFETKKKQFPPFSEILATGRYFGSAELLYIKPHFQGNNGILTQSAVGGLTSSQPFDFAFEFASRFRVGFESKYGPGLELNYFQFDNSSNLSSFTSDGINTGSAGTLLGGTGLSSNIVAANAGETLNAQHSLEVHRFGATFFKDWQLPVTRMGGGFGFQQVRVAQRLNASVLDGGGAEVATLDASHDLSAFGPQLAFRYFRPVGHTKLEFFGGLSGAVLFGNREQLVQNSVTGDFEQVGANDVLMIFEVLGGLQYVRNYADNRSFYARITLMSEAWIGGGTAVVPTDNFGFRGIGFGVGFNR